MFRCLTLKIIGCIASKSNRATKSLSDVTSTLMAIKKTNQVKLMASLIYSLKCISFNYVWVLQGTMCLF